MSLLGWIRDAFGFASSASRASSAAESGPGSPPSLVDGSAAPTGQADAPLRVFQRAFGREPEAHPALGPYRTGTPSPSAARDAPTTHHVVGLLARGTRWSTYLAVRARAERAVGWSAVDHLPAELWTDDVDVVAPELRSSVARLTERLARLEGSSVAAIRGAGLSGVGGPGVPVGTSADAPRVLWSTEGDVSFANGFSGAFVACEYAHGVSLERLLERFASRGVALPMAVAARVAHDLARALCDVSAALGPDASIPAPGRVMVTFAGRVVLTGLARDAVDAIAWRPVTLVTPAPSAPRYAAPETLKTGRASEAALAFTVGAVLHEMLAAASPPARSAAPLLELALEALHADPARRPALSALASRLASALGDDARLAPIALRAMVRTLFADEMAERGRSLELGLERARRVLPG